MTLFLNCSFTYKYEISVINENWPFEEKSNNKNKPSFFYFLFFIFIINFNILFFIEYLILIKANKLNNVYIYIFNI